MNIKAISIIVSGIVLSTLCGCEVGQQTEWDQIKQLEKDKLGMKQKIEELEAENDNLSKQMTTLSGIDPNRRFEAIATLDRIEIGKRTAIFDKDEDGTKETLIVYVKTFDETGDVVKAPGSIHLQLWDLNQKPDGALLGDWEIEPEDLKMLWMGTMMTNYYRLKYNVGDKLPANETELTVKVTFRDYITGKTFQEQKTIKSK